MALLKCKECGHQIGRTAKRCPNCGAKLHPPATPLQIAFVAAICLAIGFATFGHEKSDRPTVAQEQQAPATTAIVASAKPGSPQQVVANIAAIVDAAPAHMAENKKSLFDGKEHYFPTTDMVRRGLSDCAAVRVAVAMKDGTVSEGIALSKRAAPMLHTVCVQARQMYASSLREAALKDSANTKMEAVGADATTLRITNVLLSDAMFYQFRNNQDVNDSIKAAGFKKVVMTNGLSYLGKSGSYNIE